MAKVIVNIPVVINCDVKSFDNSEETYFNVDKTDVLQLSNMTIDADTITVSAENVVIVG